LINLSPKPRKSTKKQGKLGEKGLDWSNSSTIRRPNIEPRKATPGNREQRWVGVFTNKRKDKGVINEKVQNSPGVEEKVGG